MAFLTIEDIILSESQRGIHRLRPKLEEKFCGRAAEDLLNGPRGAIGITTGFWVNGSPETDGPPGAYFLSRGLEAIGFDPIIICDRWCLPLFEGTDLPCFEVSPNHDSWLSDWNYFSEGFSPVALVSIERCGRNAHGQYNNMFGTNVGPSTAPIDRWFDAATSATMLTIGIGDGGNEIGMGNIATELKDELNIEACQTRVNHLIIASVSNWGAFGLLAAIEAACAEKVIPTPEEYRLWLHHIVSLGAVDGVTGINRASVDNYSLETDFSVLNQLNSIIP